MFSLASSVVHFLLLAQYAAADPVPEGRILSISLCPADSQEKWTYRGKKGPSHWGEIEGYRTCSVGTSQSPINIDTESVEKDENLAKIDMNNYDTPITTSTLENNGHTIELVPTDGVERSITIDGTTYTLRQLHFHWGLKYSKGSEHTVDGKQYALEMHLVHMTPQGQIAVVGVIYQEGPTSNEELQTIVNALNQVRYKDTEVALNTPLTLNGLVPENPASYYRYSGSLTTPACAEGVTWSVLTKIIPVGRKQMSEFRKLFSATKDNALPTCTLSNNYRPVQPLNGRTVKVSQ